MDYNKNLLQETLEAMADRGKHPGDVRWVGSSTHHYGAMDHWATWDAFAARADLTYDAGFGGEEIALNLMVVGDDWWLERHEYDGSEWWEFKTLPTQPDEQRPDIVVLFADQAYR